MKYRKQLLLTFLILIHCSELAAQHNQIHGNFFSKLYFPFFLGYNFPIETRLLSGSFTKTGIEYRIRNDYGIFARFNMDNRTNSFEIPTNNATNVVDGKIHFSDFTLGLGYRIGKPKIRGYGLIQAGISSYKYPNIIVQNANNFLLGEKTDANFIVKNTLGLEYYIASNAAFVLEANYGFQKQNAIFWGDYLHSWGLTVGLTANLF
jgi:hypothetical protein